MRERQFDPLTDKLLLRKLIVMVIIKLVLLFGLWWAFVRGQGVTVSSEIMARQAVQSVEEMQQTERGDSLHHGH